MKVISQAAGSVLVQVSADDVVPHRGILQQNLLKFVGDLYNFNVRPVVNPGTPIELTPFFQFQSGEFVSKDGNIPVMQIVITTDGDAVMAKNTDAADAIMTHYLAQLDNHLGFRFAEAKPTRVYSSTLIVELNPEFVEKTSIFQKIEKVINEIVNKSQRNYKLKRLSFGCDTSKQVPIHTSINQLFSTDFVIERRAGEPLEKNRFFCQANMTTSEHIRTLEEIDRSSIG